MSGGVSTIGTVGETVGGTVGGIAGGFAGGAIGSVFGPVGTVAGRFIGSRVGQWGGRIAGGYIASKMEEANEKAEPKPAENTQKKDDKTKPECQGECEEEENKADRDRWTKGKKNSGRENAEEHWDKHGNEFPEYKDVDDYVQGTHDFIDNPPPGTQTKTRANGDVLQYNPGTNTFSSSTSNGTPRTMFRPNDGPAYWNAQ